MMSAMRALFVAWLALVSFSCASTSAPSHELPKPGEVKIRPFQFRMRDIREPSGLRVLVQEDKSVGAVAVVMVVGVGSTGDAPGKEGLAHVVEHLTFRARPTGSMSMWIMLARAGAADLNASTSFDRTTY